ncbi:MAG TPA: c-type cytochrome [Candidatus Latescibacteria bacterium]|nr:c-type cytochrome [Candidatus Latescibacterota bacterium]
MACPLQVDAQFADADWPFYHGDPTASHYSELGQITKENVGQLEVAWTYHSSESLPEGRTDNQCNPIIVDGVLYGSSPDGYFFAIEAATGEEIWQYDFQGHRRSVHVRGTSYWSDGKAARLFVAINSELRALDASTGELVTGFADRGSLDLCYGLARSIEEVGRWHSTTPVTVFEDLLIVGGFTAEGYGAVPGDIRAFDARTGERAWIFKTIPEPGEYGADTWPEGARELVGSANSWAGFAVDVERGMLFAPTGSAAFDFYGAERLGQNLFANCVIALDIRTGKRIWHYQIVHHDLWDRDVPAQPNLITVMHGGKRIDAVAQITKHGYVFVLDRETGEPLFPVEERPVPQSVVGEDKAWPTQPIPLKPPPFTRTELSEAGLSDILPGTRAYTKMAMQSMRYEGNFTPFSNKAPTILFPGTIGGGNWGGAAVDPKNGMLYVNANEAASFISLVTMVDAPNLSPYQQGRNVYARRCSACHGMNRMGGNHMGYTPPLLNLETHMTREQVLDIFRNGKGRMEAQRGLMHDPEDVAMLLTFLFENPPAGQEHISDPGEDGQLIYAHSGYNQFLDQNGYPANKPPWGTLNAIDLNEGTIKWQVTLGEYAELKERGVPPTGTENWGGPILTASGLIFIAAAADDKIRAFDQDTGEVLWEGDLPTAGFATPSTYAVNGRQYVVIASGGGKVSRPTSSAFVAFALPE